jgi:hypothetical protein
MSDAYSTLSMRVADRCRRILIAQRNKYFARAVAHAHRRNIMSNQDFGRPSSAASRAEEGLGQRASKAASDALSSATSIASDAASKAKQAASETAATVTGEVKTLLDRQVSSGADMVGHVAGAVKRAAHELDHNAPQLAGLVRTAADRMDSSAGHGVRPGRLGGLLCAAHFEEHAIVGRVAAHSAGP